MQQNALRLIEADQPTLHLLRNARDIDEHIQELHRARTLLHRQLADQLTDGEGFVFGGVVVAIKADQKIRIIGPANAGVTGAHAPQPKE